MPGYDRTGPLGRGAKTGRGLGRCNGDRRTMFNGRRGIRGGIGCRRGFGRYFYDDEIDPKAKKAILEKHKNDLELELKNINEELKKYKEDDKE